MHRIDAEVLNQAKKDLLSESPRIALNAARYLFLDGKGVDEPNPKTFTALCLRNGIDADTVAKGMWKRLPKKTRKAILRLFRDAGYKTDCAVSSPLKRTT